MTEKQELHEARIEIRRSMKIISQNLEVVDPDVLKDLLKQVQDLKQKVISGLQNSDS